MPVVHWQWVSVMLHVVWLIAAWKQGIYRFVSIVPLIGGSCWYVQRSLGDRLW